MNSKCPHCHFIQKVPDVYKSRAVKCTKCRQPFIPVIYNPLPQSENSSTPKKKLITVFWSGIPAAFKAGFLTTAGVLAALFVAFYFWSVIFIPGHKQLYPQSSAPIAPNEELDSVSGLIDKNPLFEHRKALIKLLSRDKYRHYYSAKIIIYSARDAKVDLKLRFYAEDDFLITSQDFQSCVLVGGMQNEHDFNFDIHNRLLFNRKISHWTYEISNTQNLY